jgi:hypothetical protein
MVDSQLSLGIPEENTVLITRVDFEESQGTFLQDSAGVLTSVGGKEHFKDKASANKKGTEKQTVRRATMGQICGRGRFESFRIRFVATSGTDRARAFGEKRQAEKVLPRTALQSRQPMGVVYYAVVPCPFLTRVRFNRMCGWTCHLCPESLTTMALCLRQSLLGVRRIVSPRLHHDPADCCHLLPMM